MRGTHPSIRRSFSAALVLGGGRGAGLVFDASFRQGSSCELRARAADARLSLTRGRIRTYEERRQRMRTQGPDLGAEGARERKKEGELHGR